MKFILFSLMILSASCGKNELGGRKSEAAAACLTLNEVRALCYIDEMAKLGHDPNMHDWVINQCAIIYATEGCYNGVY